MDEKKCIGICKVGEKGQIVIPKEARSLFNIKSGDNLVFLADLNKGMAIVKTDVFEDKVDNILGKGSK